VHLIAEDIAIQLFTPDDGSESAAIKVVHRTSHKEAVNNDTVSQRDNLRRAVKQLIASMNPNPEHIPPPSFLLFDRVRVKLPQSTHDGRVVRVSWDFPRSEWRYFVECPKQVVTGWYVAADLDLLDED